MAGIAELHCHLDGSLRPETLHELAARQGVAVPPDLRFRAGMSLPQALSRFAVTLSVLQSAEAVRRVAREMCEDAEAEGVTTFEIRFAPQLHRGEPPEAIVEAALEGAAGRAGLVLCGLYGEPPEVLERHVDIAASTRGVVGIDLAGGPFPGHAWGLADYAPAFVRAAELGVGRTVHAAEGRPPHEIRVAIEQLHAQRVGHGSTLLDDPDVLELVLRRGVHIEACPTSNVHTGAIARLGAHPLPRWLRRGVRASICSDNWLLSDTSPAEEHRRAAEIPGMTPELVEAAIAHGQAAAFARN